MAIILNVLLHSEAEVAKFAQTLAHHAKNLNRCIVIYLEGELGAGKTTIARNFIQTFGFKRIKSPTYSLVESYHHHNINIHHFDCYRLSDPQELEYIGIREYLQDNYIQLIEWAELGKGVVPDADLIINISGENHTRTLTISAPSTTGKMLLQLII